MSDAKKCDRCGQIYGRRKSSKMFGISVSTKNDTVAIRDTDGAIQEEYDLCDDCIKDFVEKFIKGVQFVEIPQPESND